MIAIEFESEYYLVGYNRAYGIPKNIPKVKDQ
ncbi:hypothetical protein NIES4074_21480 [Cylindrospermum sp. NIES-4074]|nr:hypothetical protein NIES4074_21480 [Cylindrospermum sp. NIES-4074]